MVPINNRLRKNELKSPSVKDKLENRKNKGCVFLRITTYWMKDNSNVPVIGMANNSLQWAFKF